MENPISRVRAVTGITEAQISNADMVELLELNDGMVYCAAADAADRVGTALIKGAGVTSVEDISVDKRRPVQMWQGLADRLRARCDREQADAWDDGPAVVEFRPHGYGGGPEAVEHG